MDISEVDDIKYVVRNFPGGKPVIELQIAEFEFCILNPEGRLVANFEAYPPGSTQLLRDAGLTLTWERSWFMGERKPYFRDSTGKELSVFEALQKIQTEYFIDQHLPEDTGIRAQFRMGLSNSIPLFVHKQRVFRQPTMLNLGACRNNHFLTHDFFQTLIFS